MTSKAARFPYGTKASFSTVADYRAVCDCGWKAGSRRVRETLRPLSLKPSRAALGERRGCSPHTTHRRKR